MESQQQKPLDQVRQAISEHTHRAQPYRCAIRAALNEWYSPADGSFIVWQ